MKAKVWNYSGWVSIEKAGLPDEIKKGFDRLLEQAGFNVLGFNEHKFKPYGYTAVWLLAESHLAVHTFPEQGAVYFELTSCNPDKTDVFKADLREIFKVREQWD